MIICLIQKYEASQLQNPEFGNFCLFVCFVALRPKSTPNHTFSWASLNKQLTVLRAHTFACNWQQHFLNDSAEGRRMTVEIISWSISMKVWDRAGIKLATPESAVRLISVARHVTDCATLHGVNSGIILKTFTHAEYKNYVYFQLTMWAFNSGELKWLKKV